MRRGSGQGAGCGEFSVKAGVPEASLHGDLKG
ncbi:hypothetical protein RKD23_007575 [Streptomyces sp. SAI-170]